ncbi:hypothetical protein HAX54_024748, partial [Datura stramonium]|nr:hypothetical protein [Datura stramonium]
VDWMQGEKDQGLSGARPAECRCKSTRRCPTLGSIARLLATTTNLNFIDASLLESDGSP